MRMKSPRLGGFFVCKYFKEHFYIVVKIIAIDTALSSCSVGLDNNGFVTVKRELEPRQHIKLILPMVDELLRQANLLVCDIDAIGFTHGPGSFTGLRIGTGVVQGLAFGTEMKIVPISTLQTMAQVTIDRGLLKPEQFVMPAIDARMNEVYWAIYTNKNGVAEPVCQDAVNIPEDIAGYLVDKGFTQNLAIGVGDGWQFAERIGVQPASLDPELMTAVEQVLALTVDCYNRGIGVPVEQVQPLYLREQTSWKKRQRLRK